MFNLFYQNSCLRKNLALVLMITMISLAGGWVLFYPKPVQALIPDIIGGPSGLMGWAWRIAHGAWEKVASKYNAAANWIRTTIKQWEWADTILSRAVAAAAEIALHMVLRMLTNEIIKWIQGGGEPKFVTDWQSFLKDAADKAGGLFVDKYLGAGWLCEPFDMDIKIALLDVPTFDTRVQCTLSDMGANINNFANDFNQGGWTEWIKLTKPQNNFYGGYYTALEEKLKLEEMAREAAGQEAIAGRGFLSIKACVQGYAKDTDESQVATCNNKDGCKTLEEQSAGQLEFVCTEEKAVTPASVISDVASRAIDRDLELLQDQIAALAPSKGILAPYITAVASALVNRVIQEGLAFVTSSGPTPGVSVNVDETPGQAIPASGQATALVEQQNLLKENLEIQLLTQQQSNLSVMQDIATIQNNILIKLKDVLAAGCSLPSWTTSQVISTTQEMNKIIETIQITASEVGTALIKRTTIASYGFGSTPVITYEIISTSPQINSEILAIQNDIIGTNQWIADTATAISSTNGFIQATDNYLELYQQTLQPPTLTEQAALNEKIALMETAKNLTINWGQIAADSSADDLAQLNFDTQTVNLTVIQITQNLLQTRGISQDYPQGGTLYEKKQSLQSKFTQLTIFLSTCSSNISY